MVISKQLIGEDMGKKVYEYTLKNANGVEISCLNYGCVITRLIAPDSRGNYENIVLGFQELAAYQENSIYAGAVVGRVAGRIGGAQFELEGITYTLAKNNGPNHLHGGVKGLQKAVWGVETIEEESKSTIRFSYTSLDTEDGYPGTLTVKVSYTLTNENELLIDYQGQADKTTLFNPTNHTYFNLSGSLKQDIAGHHLQIDSSRFLELTADLLPTGKMLNVDHTVFDFRAGRKIIEGIESDDVQNKIVGHGYDHPFVLDSNHNREIVLTHKESGRRLVIETDAAGVVLYTGNHIPDHLDFNGVKSRRYLGLCLETQGFPDSIHHGNFPSCILRKDQIFSSRTKYTFDVI